MDFNDIIAQAFGILGFLLAIMSFQEKRNKRFFIEQGLSGLMFSVNYIMMGVLPAAMFNMANLVRGLVYQKNDRKVWRIVLVEGLYTFCYVFSLLGMLDMPFQIFLSSLTFSALVVMSVFMWLGNGKHIRYAQFLYASPAWLAHNVFNFTLGGILCEVFNMMSIIVSFIRFGKDGFEK